MMIKRQIAFLARDLEFYCEYYPCRNNKSAYTAWFVQKFIAGVLYSRDFRLNILLRISLSQIFLISHVASSLIFYLYGSTISTNAKFNCRVRFCHARSLVIGPRVVFNGEFAYIFNNVTVGKLIPGAEKIHNDMPQFSQGVVFGVGSSVFGPLRATHNIVFSSNSFSSIKHINQDSTIWGHNNVKPGVFFNLDDQLSKTYTFSPPKWAKN